MGKNIVIAPTARATPAPGSRPTPLGRCFGAAKARERAAGTAYPGGEAARTALTVAAGAALWALFAFCRRPRPI